MITRIQCRAGRALADLTLADLAKAAGLGINAISQWERGTVQKMHPNNLMAIERALADRGVRIGDDPTMVWKEQERKET